MPDATERCSLEFALGECVSRVRALVAHGEVPLGIVYGTEAEVEHLVRTVAMFPADSHAPIHYPVALVRGALPRTAAFLAYLQGAEARTIFERYRFSVLR